MVSLYMTTALTFLLPLVALAVDYRCPAIDDIYNAEIGDNDDDLLFGDNDYVHPVITSCESGSITFRLESTIDFDYDYEVGVNLWYNCKGATGNSTMGPVYTDRVFSDLKERETVDVSSSNPLDCTLFGLFFALDISQVFCFETRNSTCNFDLQVTPTSVAIASGTLGPIQTTPSLFLTTQTTLTTTKTPDDLITIRESIMTVKTSTLGPSPKVISTTLPTTAAPDKLELMVVLVTLPLCIAGVCILLLVVAIFLRLRHIQRRRTNWQRAFYKRREAKEPFDPDFAPTDFDFSGQLNKFFSLLSVFDPYYPQPDTSDDERSEVLQGKSLQTEDNSSIESAILQDEGTLILNILSEETNVSITDTSDKEPPELEFSDTTVLRKQLFSPVSDGYVVNLERPYPPPKAVFQSPGSEGYVQYRDNVLTPVNSSPCEQPHFHDTQPSQSGYVDSPARVLSPNSQQMYTTLNNGYTVLLSPQYPRREFHCEEDELDPVYCNEDLKDDSGDRLYFERVVEECNFVLNETSPELTTTPTLATECSLSINPLHFEPVNYDELMHGQTSPSYVNTQAS